MNQDERLYQHHWLYQWFDEEGIKTPGNYMKAIRKRGSFDRIREIADRTYSSPLAKEATPTLQY